MHVSGPASLGLSSKRGTWHLAPGTWHLAPGTARLAGQVRRRDLAPPTIGALGLTACGAFGRQAAGTGTPGTAAPNPTARPASATAAARAETPQVTLPTEETVLQTLRAGHPRLLLLPADVEHIRRTVETDGTARAYRESVARSGEKILAEPPAQRVLIGPRLLEVSRKVLERVYTLALLFRLDGEAKWVARAAEEMRAAAAFSDWNPSHFLDVAEMSHALAIGYDWLYDALSAEDRATVTAALVEKGLRPAEAAYKAKAWWAQDRFNWNNVCNGGMATAALAVADAEPDLAHFVLFRAIMGLPKALASYAPDGAWAEGPGYWGYATKYTVLAFGVLQSALGTDFGLSTMPGLPETGLFRLQSVGPTKLFFNFADAGDRSGDEPSLFWLARRYHSPLYAWGARDASSGSPRDLMWYDARGTKEELTAAGLDARYTGDHLVFMRSAWTDSKALYVGFKGGDNKANHSHLDLGTFVLDALGQRWAIDLGPDDYDLPDYFGRLRWSYYRLRTEGHNTLTLDGQNQDPKAAAPITSFTATPDAVFAVADLTAGYAPAGGKRVRRGVALLDGRTRVLVQDEVEAAHPVEIVWAMHTKAEIVLRGETAVLTQGGVALEARLLSPKGARFESAAVQIPRPQRPAPGVKKLLVRLPEKTAATQIVVLLTPIASPGSAGASAGGGAPVPAPKVTPLDRWPAAPAASPR